MTCFLCRMISTSSSHSSTSLASCMAVFTCREEQTHMWVRQIKKPPRTAVHHTHTLHLYKEHTKSHKAPYCILYFLRLPHSFILALSMRQGLCKISGLAASMIHIITYTQITSFDFGFHYVFFTYGGVASIKMCTWIRTDLWWTKKWCAISYALINCVSGNTIYHFKLQSTQWKYKTNTYNWWTDWSTAAHLLCMGGIVRKMQLNVTRRWYFIFHFSKMFCFLLEGKSVSAHNNGYTEATTCSCM